MGLILTFKTAFAFTVIVILCSCSSGPPEEVVLSGKTMGTTYSVKYVPVSGVSSESLQVKIDNKLIWVNQLMSTWQADSELSQFNQYRGSEPFKVSPELVEVVKQAQKLSVLSDGAYDVTAGAIFKLWGFDGDARPKHVPSANSIKEARDVSGIDKLVIRENALQKKVPELYVNLSSIAKGYGVDVVAELMQENSINNYLVEIGGETRLSGLKANGERWKIAIEKPVSFERSIQRVLTVTDISIATSGDYRNYFEEDGVRYSHLIDPRSAKPISHNLLSATVLHKSNMVADGFATLFNVVGADQALKIAEQNDLAVLLITKESDGFKEHFSAAMKNYL